MRVEYISDRLEQILITLGEASEPLTSAQLAEKVKVSARTIKKDVSELNAILKDYDAVIHARTGVGYKLSVNDEFLYNQFLTELKRRELRTAQTVPKYRYERVNYIVKKLLTVDYYLTIEDLVDELYISRSTLTADLKEVREIFKDYNLELTSRPNYGILLVGEEIAKRLCIAEYFFHANISTGYFAADNAMFVSSTNQDEIRFVRDLLEEIMEKYSIHMSDQSLQNFVIHIIIAIRRWKFYNYVKVEDENGKVRQQSLIREWPAARELVERLQTKLEILLPQEEILYFALHFKSKHITQLDEITSEEIEQVEKTLYDIYRMLQKRFGVIAINKDRYEEYLRMHIPAMVARLRSGLVMRNPMIYDFLNKYLFSTHITMMISDILEQNFSVRMNKNEFAYLVLYTNLLFSTESRTHNGKILVVCGRGRPETITLINEINENHAALAGSIEICDVSELENHDLHQAELILSTVPLEASYAVPYIYMDGRLSYGEQIQQSIKHNRLSFRKLRQYFSPRCFNGSLKGSVRDEVFREVAKGFDNWKEILAMFWEAEHILSHETTKGVVFLHTLKPLPESFIYIGFLKKPIIWNKLWAQAVIFVNINDDLDSLRLGYDFISEMINDPREPFSGKLTDYDSLIEVLSKN